MRRIGERTLALVSCQLLGVALFQEPQRPACAVHVGGESCVLERESRVPLLERRGELSPQLRHLARRALRPCSLGRVRRGLHENAHGVGQRPAAGLHQPPAGPRGSPRTAELVAHRQGPPTRTTYTVAARAAAGRCGAAMCAMVARSCRTWCRTATTWIYGSIIRSHY